jgi:heme/copper-type cytochrome/quinol oxidase subunit 3
MNDNGRLGMLLFISSEAVFFLLLVLAYVFYHHAAGNGAEAARVLDTEKTGVFSLFLFASSATVHRAGTSLRRRRIGAVRGWLAATVLLGLVFLGGQAHEYAGLVHRNITISRDLFGTTFFTLTGFHGLHVFLGLVMLTLVLVLTSRRWVEVLEAGALEGVSMYWHFVDAVWVVIFAVVYLWSAL